MMFELNLLMPKDYDEQYEDFILDKYREENSFNLERKLDRVEDSIGYYNSDEQTCNVKLRLTQYFLDVISHEVIHMVMWNMGEEKASDKFNKVSSPLHLGDAVVMSDSRYFLLTHEERLQRLKGSRRDFFMTQLSRRPNYDPRKIQE